ncbi:hypothetical protein QQM79_05790 [Marinobacteraceae bacterium S3BR75-40.1]
MAAKDNGKDENEEGQEGSKKGLLSNRWVLLGGTLVLVVGLSVGVTWLLFGGTGPSGNPEKAAPPTQLEQLQTQLQSQQERLDQQAQQLAQLQSQLEASRDSSMVTVTREMLIAQEESFVTFLQALKEGMHDIAHMVRGSRDWLELYEARLDKAIEQSEKRKAQLQSWTAHSEPGSKATEAVEAPPQD